MQTVIRIANPEAGGKKYTSGKRALEYIAQGRAALLDDGTLFFAERRTPQPDNTGESFHWHSHTERSLGGVKVGLKTKQAERTTRK